jgi:hypothetical protein
MRVILIFFFLSFSVFAFGQDENPIQWTYSSARISPGVYEVHVKATLASGWHTYSATTPAGGPVPTSVAFDANPLVALVGAVREDGKLNKHFEPLFGVDVCQYGGSVDFVQKVSVKHPIKVSVSGAVTFMVCNDHECMRPTTEHFSVVLN